MSFTYDPTTLVGKVRFQIGDYKNADLEPGTGVRPDGNNFSDEEIQFYLDQNDGDVIGAAHDLLVVLATEYATRATSVMLGPFSESYKETILNIRRQIAMLERRMEEQKQRYRRIPIARSTNLRITFTG